MELEAEIARHYTHGALETAIRDALIGAGKDLDALTAADLAPVDEFHIGGRQATADLAAQLETVPGAHLLDIGSGLGGASRYFAHKHGCRVTGIDLTEEYARAAAALARLNDRVSYRHASALALPFAASTFDGTLMLHVGMNIAAKAELFAEVRRVVKPGGDFAIYDVMHEGEGEIRFPVPWASVAETSFVETAGTYRRLLGKAGFAIVKERSRRDFAIDFFPKDACARDAGRCTAATRASHSDGRLGAGEGREHDRQSGEWPDCSDRNHRARDPNIEP